MIKITMVDDDKTFMGVMPIQIIKLMRGLMFFQIDKDDDFFITFMVEQAADIKGETLTVTGSTTDARAESLLDELVAKGLATRTDL